MPKQAVILLVEDSDSDVLLIQRAFKSAHIENPMFVANDGNAAIAYLSGIGAYADRSKYPLADVVLLDIYMPQVSGFEVLSWIRQQPHLRFVRVLMLTASLRSSDLNRAYALGANSFLLKPFDFENLVELSRTLQEYWLVDPGNSEDYGSSSGLAA